MKQFPAPGTDLLFHAGDTLTVTLQADSFPLGKAIFRTNIGQASINRAEITNHTEQDLPIAGHGWRDLPMTQTQTNTWSVNVPLLEEGIFSGKCCFLPKGGQPALWPEGGDLCIKVAPAHTVKNNGIYAAFIRQFGATKAQPFIPHGGGESDDTLTRLDEQGYCVIPPSGTFRSFAKCLPHIVHTLGFRNILLLPIHPTPTTYARMGRYGSPFAATDFLSIDPALAEFDTKASPIEQFSELVAQVHALDARILMDLPANHSGWASTLQTHHPEWFKHNQDDSYHSPGAWGVTWEDLVELDYSHTQLQQYMADVFLYWCRKGVDGFRCDAGYMIPEATWSYIVARVRAEFPETVFLLEGLGGSLETTDRLLKVSGLDWSYSELFQTYDRSAMERELPSIFARSEAFGPLVHFAETHDNNRLAAYQGNPEIGKVWARMRVRISALLSQSGAWGITAGVEYFAQQKIDVHGCGGLNWGATDNMVEEIATLNALLNQHPAFGAGVHLRMVQCGDGNSLAVWREGKGRDLLILANLDPEREQPVNWQGISLPERAWDHLSKTWVVLTSNSLTLPPGAVLCLDPAGAELPTIDTDERLHDLMLRRMGERRRVTWHYPKDLNRIVPVPKDSWVAFSAHSPFRVYWRTPQGELCDGGRSVKLPTGEYLLLSEPKGDQFLFETMAGDRVDCRNGRLAVARTITSPTDLGLNVTGSDVRQKPYLRTILGNGAGAMSQVRLAWGTIRSQYDAILAANLNPAIPVDRTVIWTRCRAWVQYCGYSTELSASCLNEVHIDPAGRYAEWEFSVPCGMGMSADLTLHLTLRPLENEVRLTVKRSQAKGRFAPKDSIRLVLRPDIEWRSFHHKTKAYEVEQEWPSRIADRSEGFSFGDSYFHAEGGAWHREDQWLYGVEHADDQERGQEGHSDLYSPGWFSFDLPPKSSATLTATAGKTSEGSWEDPTPRQYTNLESVLRDGLDLFIVRRDAHKSIIAGYPWFLDWGRDTLIVARGVLAAGKPDVVKDILAEFGRFEQDGKLPNIIHGETVGNWDTADAPLWYCRVVAEYAEKVGIKEALSIPCGERTSADVVRSILKHYQSGTSNGIVCDPQTGLVYSPSHFTWMDTNYPAGTPRQGYPIEIQALWIASLRFAATHLDPSFEAIADRATASLLRYFPLPKEGLSDCLLAANASVSAVDALPDDAIRPNQLFAITLGILDEQPQLAESILRVTEQLLLPGSIRSLADAPVTVPLPIWRDGQLLNDPNNPYWPYYSGDEDTRRKPAYHNGTGWGWVFPQWPEALAHLDPTAKTFARDLLSSCAELLRTDCVGHLPENSDGGSPHWPKGCGAQAWSESELVRVLLKLA